MAKKYPADQSYPILSKELLKQRKRRTSEETILDLDEDKLIFVNPDNEDADFNQYFQSRSFYGNDKEIEQLKDSILSNGILEPLLVCEGSDPRTYQVLEGNRRAYVLYKILQESPSAKTPFGWSLSSVAVKITENPQKIIDREYRKWLAENKNKEISEDAKLECKDFISDQVFTVYNKEALHRNTQRKQWTWVEQMRSCKYRIDHGESAEDVASSQNMTKATLIKNIKRYEKLKLYPDVLEALNAEKITKSVAALFTNTDPENKNRASLLESAIKENWSSDKVDNELVFHKLKLQTRNRKKVVKKQPVISFANYNELTDFFLSSLLSLSSDYISDFLEEVMDHKESSPVSQEFKEKFFKQISEVIISQPQKEN